MIGKHSYGQVDLKVEPNSFLYEFFNSGDPLYYIPLQGSDTFSCAFFRTFPELLKVKIKIFQDSNSRYKMLLGDRDGAKNTQFLFHMYFKKISRIFPGHFHLFFFPRHFQAWKFIFFIFQGAWEPCIENFTSLQIDYSILIQKILTIRNPTDSFSQRDELFRIFHEKISNALGIKPKIFSIYLLSESSHRGLKNGTSLEKIIHTVIIRLSIGRLIQSSICLERGLSQKLAFLRTPYARRRLG